MASKFDDFTANARANGYTWDDIHGYLTTKRSEAEAAGYSPQEIDSYLGQGNPDALKPAMKSQAQSLIDALPKPEGSGVGMSYLDAFRQSSAGLLIFGHTKVDTPPPDGELAHIASMIGGTVGDLPAMAVGAVGGAAAGAAMTANPVGAALGGAMGGFALPQSIKSNYADGVKNGAYKSPWDYASRQAAVWHETAKAAATGAAMVAGGEVAAPLGALAKLGGEVAATTVAAKALEGQLPAPEDFLDNAIMLGAFKGVQAATEFAPQLRDQLLDRWVKKGDTPQDALALARIDESTRQDLIQPPPPEYKEASVTPDLDGSGDLVIEKPEQITQAAVRVNGETFTGITHGLALLHAADKLDPALDGDKRLEKTADQGFVTSTGRYVSRAEGLKLTMSEGYRGELYAEDYLKEEQLYAAKRAELLPKDERLAAEAAITPVPEATGKETSFNPLAPDYEADPGAAQAAVGSRIAPPEPGATLGEKIDRVWMDVRKQYLDRDAPINDLEEKIAAGRPIDSAQSPKVLREITRVSGERSRLMVEKGMIDFEGDRSGPGLLEILKPFEGEDTAPPEAPTFWKYAVARWAVEKAAQGKETGVDINAAKAVVKHADGVSPPAPGMVRLYRVEPDNGIPKQEQRAQAFNDRLNLGVMKDGKLPDWLTESPDFKATVDATNRWFSADQENVAWYKDHLKKDGIKPKVTYVDMPAKEAEQYRVSNLPKGHSAVEFSRRPAEEFFVPREVADARGDLAEGASAYKDAFDQLVGWQNGTLEYLKEAGVISEDAFNRMTEENAARIPGYRAGKEGNGGGQGFNPVKEFKGSELPVKDILTSLIHDAFIRVELANRARYSTAVNDLGIEAGIAEATGRTHAIKFELGLDELEKLGAEQVAEGDSAIWRHINKTLAPDETLSVKDGKVTITKWADPEIPEILRGYDIPTLSLVGKMMAALTRVQKALIVLDPTFAVRMKIYDIPQQFITNPGFTNPLFQFVEGFGHTLFRTETWRDAVNRGVVNDAFKHTTEDAYTKNVFADREDPSFTTGIRNAIQNAAAQPLRALKYWAGLFHAASEVGNLAARDRKSPDRLRNAAEATQSSFPPPGRGGSQTRLINQIQPFFSAYISGLETTARSQLGIGQTTGGKPFSAAQFTAKAIALVTMPVIASYLMNRDKDWYKNAPDWQKDNGLLFPPIEPGGSPIFLKFPPVISFLYGAMPRRIVAAIDQHDPTALTKGSWQSLAWSFAPPGGLIQYNIALPVIEKIANYSFHRGAPLNPASLSGPTGPLAPEVFTPYSTDLAKSLAYGLSNIPLIRNFNVTAPEVDNFVHSWGGSIGPAIVTYAEKALGRHPEAPVDHWEDLPGASSFFARNTGASAVPVKDFVSVMDHIAQVHASLGMAMADGNLARFKELVQANPAAAAMLPPSFGTSVRGINAAGNASLEPQYLDAIREAVGSINTAGIADLAQTQQTMGLLRSLAAVVESVETPVNRQYVEQLTGGTGIQGPMSATDKRQLLDRIYAQMVTVAGYGNNQAAQLGVKP